MNMREALLTLGVTDTTLSDEEKGFLDEKGYLPLPEILSDDQVRAFVRRPEQIEEDEGEEAGAEFHQEAGTIRISDLVNKSPLFEICFTHPRVLAAMAHVLVDDFKLSSPNGRAAIPGHGLQALHVDGRNLNLDRSGVTPLQRGDHVVCNSIWLLTDFTPKNGATRLVPGTHLSGKMPADSMDDPTRPHPDEIHLYAPAGTVAIFNSHTWHGGTLNSGDTLRRAMHSYFTRRHLPQQTDQRKYIRPENYNRLNEAARFILDV